METNTDKLDQMFEAQRLNKTSHEMTAIEKQENIKQIKAKEKEVRKQIEEVCCRHKKSVEEHKYFIRSLQQISATNEQLQDCFLKTEVTLQKEKDKFDKMKIKKETQMMNIELQMNELESDSRVLSKRTLSTTTQFLDTSRVLQKHAGKQQVLEAEIANLQQKSDCVAVTLKEVQEKLMEEEKQITILDNKLNDSVNEIQNMKLNKNIILKQNSVKDQKLHLIKDTKSHLTKIISNDKKNICDVKKAIQQLQKCVNLMKCKDQQTQSQTDALHAQITVDLQALVDLTEEIITINTKVLFCDDCSQDKDSKLHHYVKYSIPEVAPCQPTLHLPDGKSDIEKTNDCLSLYGLPSLKLEEKCLE